MNDQEYQHAVKKIRSSVAFKKVGGSAEEYANEAYLQLHEAGTHISAQALFEKARTLLINSHQQANLFVTKETTRYCKICRQDLPMALFYLRYYKRLERYYPDCYCKDCRKKMSQENMKKQQAKLSEGHLRRHQKALKHTRSLEDIKDSILQRRQTLQRRKEGGLTAAQDGRQQLMDWYIVSLLKGRGYYPEEITPELIETTRGQIKEKRRLQDRNKNCQNGDTP